jgi:hypothetical protein
MPKYKSPEGLLYKEVTPAPAGSKEEMSVHSTAAQAFVINTEGPHMHAAITRRNTMPNSMTLILISPFIKIQSPLFEI